MTLLKRSFNLAREAGKLNVVPLLPKKLKENNVRKGFFEYDDFRAFRAALPEEVVPVVTFAFWTGCRKGEILSLKWSQVDLSNRTVRLEAGETKNDQPRIIPLVPELFQVLAMQKEIREASWPDCPWVFFRQGKQIHQFRGAWEHACARAGLVDEKGKASKLFHDLRSTGFETLFAPECRSG